MDDQFTPMPVFSSPAGQIAAGSIITITPPLGTSLYYTLDGTDPRVSGGGVQPGALTSNGSANVTVNSNVRIVARAKGPNGWKGTFSGPNAATFVIALPSLRITEIMYHPLPPPPGSTNTA